jgi:serine/threonine protein kinase
MEFMPRGSLFAILQDHSTSLPWLMRLRFALDISRGMHHVHEMLLLHRDLKSLNVLVAEDMLCKVADFGQSRGESTTLTAMMGELSVPPRRTRARI